MLNVLLVMLYIFLSLGLAIYTRSPAAFASLASFKLCQLPSVTTLKSYTRSNIEKPGECAQRLEAERTQYNERIAEATKAGKKSPLSEGVLIADEVKVAAKLHRNSRDDSIVGHSMTADEMATLHDLYSVLNDDTQSSKADYIMQTSGVARNLGRGVLIARAHAR